MQALHDPLTTDAHGALPAFDQLANGQTISTRHANRVPRGPVPRAGLCRRLHSTLRHLLARVYRELALSAASHAAALHELGPGEAELRVGPSANPLEPQPATLVAGPTLSASQLVRAGLQQLQLLVQIKLALRRKRKLLARLRELRRQVGNFGTHKIQLLRRQRQALLHHSRRLDVAQAGDQAAESPQQFGHVVPPNGQSEGRTAILASRRLRNILRTYFLLRKLNAVRARMDDLQAQINEATEAAIGLSRRHRFSPELQAHRLALRLDHDAQFATWQRLRAELDALEAPL